MPNSKLAAKMPKMLYGTAWKKERTSALVTTALEAGFRGIDTACQPRHYNEPGVGEGIANALRSGIKREDLYIQSKFTPQSGQDPQSIPYNPKDRLAKQVSTSFACSLENLRIDSLDALVLHSPLQNWDDLQEVWAAMESFADQGLVRYLGISNCYSLEVLQKLHAWSRVKPQILQNRFYQETQYDKSLRKFCHDNLITYQSFWSLTANPHIVNSPLLSSIAERENIAKEQVFYLFLCQIGITPLNGTTSEEHMRDDLQALNQKLNQDDVAQILRQID